MSTQAQKKFNELLSKVIERGRELEKSDSALKDVIYCELAYAEIESRSRSDLEKLLLANIFLRSKGRDLKLVCAENNSKYYTINGMQYICEIKVPLINIFGRVFRENISLKSFCAARNVVYRVLDENGMTDTRFSDGRLSEQGEIAYKFIFNAVVGSDIDHAFSVENLSLVRRLIAQNKIAFQAIHNGIDAAEKAVMEYRAAS